MNNLAKITHFLKKNVKYSLLILFLILIFVYFFYFKKNKEGLEIAIITTEDEDALINNFNNDIKEVIRTKLTDTNSDTIKNYVNNIYNFIVESSVSEDKRGEADKVRDVDYDKKVEDIIDTLIDGQYDNNIIDNWEDVYIYFLKNYISEFYKSYPYMYTDENENKDKSFYSGGSIFLSNHFKETFKLYISFRLLTVSLLYYILYINSRKNELEIIKIVDTQGQVNTEKIDENTDKIENIGKLIGLLGLTDFSTDDGERRENIGGFFQLLLLWAFIDISDDPRQDSDTIDYKEKIKYSAINNDYRLMNYILDNNILKDSNKSSIFNTIVENNLKNCDNLINIKKGGVITEIISDFTKVENDKLLILEPLKDIMEEINTDQPTISDEYVKKMIGTIPDAKDTGEQSGPLTEKETEVIVDAITGKSVEKGSPEGFDNMDSQGETYEQLEKEVDYIFNNVDTMTTDDYKKAGEMINCILINELYKIMDEASNKEEEKRKLIEEYWLYQDNLDKLRKEIPSVKQWLFYTSVAPTLDEEIKFKTENPFPIKQLRRDLIESRSLNIIQTLATNKGQENRKVYFNLVNSPDNLTIFMGNNSNSADNFNTFKNEMEIEGKEFDKKYITEQYGKCSSSF